MPKKAGVVFVMMGAVLILSALLLFLYNRQEDLRVGEEAENLVAQMEQIVAEQQNETKPSDSNEWDHTDTLPDGSEIMATESAEMLEVEIDGYGYIGYLSIPDMDVELPVMSDWDYKRLKIAPCRQFGSVKTDDLVIAAHNYKKHFGQLKDLEMGAVISFVDMEGNRIRYAVTKLELLDPKQVAEVLDSGHDLVLYTCTYGGKNRVAVFCDRMDVVTAESAS